MSNRRQKATYIKLELGQRATDEQIAEWKDKYGDVFELSDTEVSDSLPEDELLSEEALEDVLADENARYIYVRKPSRQIISGAQRLISAEKRADSFRFTEVILKNTCLAGHPDFFKEEGLILSVGEKLQEIIQMRDLQIKKL